MKNNGNKKNNTGGRHTTCIMIILAALTLALSVFMLTACAKKSGTAGAEANTAQQNAAQQAESMTETAAPAQTKAAETEAPETEPETEPESPVATEDLPDKIVIRDIFLEDPENKVRGISDYHQFQNEIGIKVKARLFPGETVCKIINESIASVDFTMQSLSGEDVYGVLRASKDKKAAEIMHGLDDPDLPKPAVSQFQAGDGSAIELSSRYSKANHCDLWTWEKDGIYFTIVSSDNADPMVISDMLATAMAATIQEQ